MPLHGLIRPRVLLLRLQESVCTRMPVQRPKKKGKKPVSIPKKIDPETLPANGDMEQSGASVDKIRDILFGSQMRDYDRRFLRLEEKMLKESADAREDARRRPVSVQSPPDATPEPWFDAVTRAADEVAAGSPIFLCGEVVVAGEDAMRVERAFHEHEPALTWIAYPNNPTETPDPRLKGVNFSIRWTGEQRAPVTGRYSFYTVSDDGVRMWIGNQLLIDNWTDHGATTNTSVGVSLQAGQRYSVTLQYYERYGDAVIELLWAYPGQGTQVACSHRLQ